MSAALPLPRAVLFDWDNTLVDTWWCLFDAVNATLTAMGHAPWQEEEARARIAKSLREVFPELFGDRWEEARAVFYQAFEAMHLQRLAVLPGAEALLSALTARGVRLGVVSNKTGRLLRAEADHLGWTPRFAALVGAGDAARDKPAADPVHLALAGSGLEPSPEVWFVGDNRVDVQCAIESGCLPLLITTHPPPEHELAACPPHAIFRNCEELVMLVESHPVPKAAKRC